MKRGQMRSNMGNGGRWILPDNPGLDEEQIRIRISIRIRIWI